MQPFSCFVKKVVFFYEGWNFIFSLKEKVVESAYIFIKMRYPANFFGDPKSFPYYDGK
jgi:hypothetical protein